MVKYQASIKLSIQYYKTLAHIPVGGCLATANYPLMKTLIKMNLCTKTRESCFLSNKHETNWVLEVVAWVIIEFMERPRRSS